MKLALYKGSGNFYDKLIRTVTRSKYSHCELVIDGLCYSSSPRDGGVRMKYIDLTDGKWDVIDVPGEQIWALDWFINNIGRKYDWLGAITSVLPFSLGSKDKFFCSEACAIMMGLDNPQHRKPHTLI